MRNEQLLVTSKEFKSIKQLFGLTDNKIIIAGSCSVESPELMDSIAKELVKNGVHFARGGAYKPRTSPYSFHREQQPNISEFQYFIKNIRPTLNSFNLN